MALETLSSNELLNFIIYDTICATPFSCNDISEPTLTNNPCTTFFHLHNPNSNSNPNPKPNLFSQQLPGTSSIELMSSKPSLTSATAKMSSSMAPVHSYNCSTGNDPDNNYGAKTNNQNLGVQKKKRRRRPRVCKNKEEAENQRMTHIAVERNRRKQINEHLAVLRSLMPESYVQRGDQASIVGGAIEFVKELEHLLQSLEAQKFLSIQQQQEDKESEHHEKSLTKLSSSSSVAAAAATPPFAQFFTYPQYTCSQLPNKYTSKSKAAIADIEVTLIETHASLRILSQQRLAQLSKLVSCFQTMHLSVLHLNVTTLDPLVLYSISLKVEEGCRLNSADEIAGVVHQMLRIIEEEPTLCVVHSKN